MSAVTEATALHSSNLEVPRVPLRNLLHEPQNGLSKRRGDAGKQVPVLRLADVVGGVIDESAPRAINLTEKEIEKYALQRGDLVCIRVNGSRSLVGRVVPFVLRRVWAYCDHFIRLRPRHNLVDYRYLTHYLNTREARRYVELNMVSSAGQNTVSQGTMLELIIPLPDLAQQRVIVAEIEKQFSRLDEAVVNLMRVKANLKRYKAAVLKAAVEGRLVPTEAELARRERRSYETGAQLLERILETRRSQWKGKGKYKEPAVTDANDRIELPEGWVWSTMAQIGEMNRGKSKHRPRDDPKLYGGPYPFIQTGDVRRSEGAITEHGQTYSELGLQQSRLWPAGTLCITIAANIAETGILQFEACFPDSVVGFIAYGGVVTTRYIDYFIRTARDKLERFASATAQKNINLNVLEGVAIALPPLAEQLRIVAEVDRHLSIIREVEAEAHTNLERATALHQAVLRSMFSS